MEQARRNRKARPLRQKKAQRKARKKVHRRVLARRMRVRIRRTQVRRPTHPPTTANAAANPPQMLQRYWGDSACLGLSVGLESGLHKRCHTLREDDRNPPSRRSPLNVPSTTSIRPRPNLTKLDLAYHDRAIIKAAIKSLSRNVRIVYMH